MINRRWFAIVVPALLGLGLGALCVRFFESYGWSLFFGLPLIVCLLSTFCTTYRTQFPFWPAYGISLLSLLCLGGFILICALDGAFCLILAFPLSAVMGLIGALLGVAISRACQRGISSTLPLLLVFIFPGLVAFEQKTKPQPEMRKVVTSVAVRAPIANVWQTVIAFPKITEPPTGIFSCGVAYPVEARIEGSGPGAVRHCIFSTGSFVEPVTQWQEPRLLAFDVSSSPPPMQELSFYEHIEAPHLHGHMVSHHGQFHLSEVDGKVVLEGTTRYTHTLLPEWYWGLISDYMIHRIHERVLNHIKRISEG